MTMTSARPVKLSNSPRTLREAQSLAAN
jgi:hypothetical protein